LGLPLPGHAWVDEENWGYRSYESLEQLNQAYQDLLVQLRPLIAQGLSAAVYTQTTDVEIEVNGVMTYDREVVKLSDASVALHAGLYGPQPEFREVVPTSGGEPQPWRYTTVEPGEGWYLEDFKDGTWTRGPGGFGNRRPPGTRAGTEWDTPDLWLRRSFRLTAADLASLTPETAYLWVHHDEDAEIYLNGVHIATLGGFVTGYHLYSLTPESLGLLVEGTNTLAVHVHQTEGGQYLDMGLVQWGGGGG